MDLTGWSLVDIDETDIESLIPFMFEYPKWKANNSKTRKPEKQPKKLFADQASWI